MERQRSVKRRHNHLPKPPFAERAKEGCRQFTAFMFSNVGIIILVVLYMIGGASMFKAIEGQTDYELAQNRNNSIAMLRGSLMNQLWNITLQMNDFDRLAFESEIDTKISEYQQKIVLAVRDGWIGPNSTSFHAWTFPNALLYSLTVITTIGYGNITPRTIFGKYVTIIYAIVGMPLFLLYLSNIGDIMAKSFKWIYARLCLCRICPKVAKKREARLRRKIRALQRQMNNANYEMDGDYDSALDDEEEEEEEKISSITSHSSESKPEIEGQNNNAESSSSTSESTEDDLRSVSVPISVSLMIMISYILGGALVFIRWEESWKVLTGCYFCFISLSSIGFGDVVPVDKIFKRKEHSSSNALGVDVQFIICAVYLLLGMALIAMCFNLMQEQVISNILAFKRGIQRCFQCHKCKNNNKNSHYY